MIVKIKCFLVLAGFLLFLFVEGCGKSGGGHDLIQNKSAEMESSLSDKPISTYQTELLSLAFNTATAIPLKPHIKDRSRAQEKVVKACLELDQPVSALRFIEEIYNWRRGTGYAELAFYCAERGYSNKVQEYLNLADQVSDSAEGWCRDRIRVKITQTYTLLGQNQQAKKYETDIAKSETGKVAQVKALVADENSFDEQMNLLGTLTATEDFDTLRNTLKAYVNLFNRFYEDVNRRSLAEEKIKNLWSKMPVFIRIELLMEMAGFALDHADKIKGLELVNEAKNLFDGAKWPLKNHIKIMSKLNELRYQAGDRKTAKTEMDKLLNFFNTKGDKIVNIYRAGVLRPIAEAYQSMRDKETALLIYKRAVEEGIKNPNSRPRAEDLSATCLSMALNKVEPDAELWDKIRKIKDELGDPW